MMGPPPPWTRSNANPNPVPGDALAPGTLGRKKPPVAPGDAPGDDDAEPSADAGNDPPSLNELIDDDASPPGPRARRASSGLGLGGTIPLGAT